MQYTNLSKSKYESLFGKLLYIHRCARPSKTSINRMLELFRNNFSNNIIKLSEDFFFDLNWFLAFLPGYNGIKIMNKQEIPECNSLHIDTCLTCLGAGEFGEMGYMLHKLLTFQTSRTKSFTWRRLTSSLLAGFRVFYGKKRLYLLKTTIWQWCKWLPQTKQVTVFWLSALEISGF